jgi:hypothetical protein
MLVWGRLIQLGDLELMLPAATAMSASMLVSGARRMAGYWMLLFLGTIGLVGVSKILYMGWGGGIPGLDYKAVSGHACTVTLVLPVLLFLLLHGRVARAAALGLGAGLALGALMAVLLVIDRQHSVAEVVLGWMLGAMAGIKAISLAAAMPPLAPLTASLAFVVTFALAAWLMQAAHVGYWMVLAARYLSGNKILFPLGFD